LRPPSLPSATAAGFFSAGSNFSSSPTASLTTLKASALGSRGRRSCFVAGFSAGGSLLERFGMALMITHRQEAGFLTS
jgi:hypothetical protein